MNLTDEERKLLKSFEIAVIENESTPIEERNFFKMTFLNRIDPVKYPISVDRGTFESTETEKKTKRSENTETVALSRDIADQNGENRLKMSTKTVLRSRENADRNEEKVDRKIENNGRENADQTYRENADRNSAPKEEFLLGTPWDDDTGEYSKVSVKTGKTSQRKKTVIIKKEYDPQELDEGTSFEVNFAQFPLFFLSKSDSDAKDAKSIIYEEEKADGKRTWTVEGFSEYGLQSTTALQLMFEFFQIWKETGFKSHYIDIGTPNSLLKRMGNKRNDGRYYANLKRDITILTNMKIKAQNTYYSNTKGHKLKDIQFQIFTGLKRYGEVRQENLFGENQLMNNNIAPDDRFVITIDHDFYQMFHEDNNRMSTGIPSLLFSKFTPTEQKLALFISTIFNPHIKERKYEFTRNIYSLASQIPIRCKERKHIKSAMKIATEGLIAKGFEYLKKYEFKGDNIIFYAVSEAALENKKESKSGAFNKMGNDIDAIVEDILEVTGSNESIKFYRMVAASVDKHDIYRALSETKAEAREPAKFFSYKMKPLVEAAMG